VSFIVVIAYFVGLSSLWLWIPLKTEENGTVRGEVLENKTPPYISFKKQEVLAFSSKLSA